MVPAFLESASVALGRLGDFRAVPLLIKIMLAKFPSGSAEAALSLANYSCRTVFIALLQALKCDDGWIRFAAFRALKKLTGEDHFIDWIFASKKQYTNGYNKYKKIFNHVVR